MSLKRSSGSTPGVGSKLSEAGVAALDDLSDVDLTGVAAGDRLEYVDGLYSQVLLPVPSVTAPIGGSNPSYVVDENESTYFAGPNYTATQVVTLIFDFGEAVTLAKVQLLCATGTHKTTGWELWYSDNGSTYYTLGTAGDAATTNVSFASQSHQWWKITDTDSTTYGNWWVYEVTFWESAAMWSPTAPGMFDLLSTTKSVADTPDDEFAASTLDAKWTAVSGTSGTVDLLETAEVETYDLATRSGWLLMQAGAASGQIVELRQDWTLGDGESIVVAFAGPGPSLGSSATNNERQYGITLNDTDTSHNDGDYIVLWHDTETTDNSHILFQYDISGLTAIGTSGEPMPDPGNLFLRIARSGTSYYGFWSAGSGSAWQPMGSVVFATAPTNLWIFDWAQASGHDPIPITGVCWVRQGTNSLDPWSI